MPELIWSPEAEQALIGSALLDQRCMGQVGHVSADDFAHADHRTIWAEIKRQDAARLPVDVVTIGVSLGDTVPDAMGYLNTCARSVLSASHARRYADVVRDKAQRRALFDAAMETADLAATAADMGEALERIGSALNGMHKASVRKSPRLLADVALERTEHYEALKRREVSTGWGCSIPAVNAALSGGFRPGKLYFIGARPGVGKSSLSAQLLMDLARDGHKGLFLSQEMGAEEVADRAVSNRGRIEFGRLMSGDLSDSDWSKAADMLEEMRNMPVWVDDQPALTLADIRHKVRSISGLQVLVLDYLQLCSKSANTSAASRNSEIEEISRGLKALAMDMGMAVIVLSQLNREVEKRPNKRPVLSDLRDSGSIEQDADAILLLWPVRDLDDGGKLIGCEIAKNRQGRSGVEIPLDFRGHVQRWAESTQTIRGESFDQPAQQPKRRAISG